MLKSIKEKKKEEEEEEKTCFLVNLAKFLRTSTL